MSWSPPDEGLCAVCEETVVLRRDGRTRKHPRPIDADAPYVFTIINGRSVADTNCPGADQQPAVRLEMTFARWLRAHHKRRDARDNPVSFLAQWVFKPCTRTRAKTVAEVSWQWSAPAELRAYLLVPGRNDWIGRYIDQVEAGYEAYTAARQLV